MENTKKRQDDVFRAKNINLKLQDRQPRREHCNEFRFYFDKKLRKCMTNNINPETPYRCSLSHQNGLAATRGKVLMEPTFSARKRLREKELEKEREQENGPKFNFKKPNSLLVLPKISQESRPLVSIPVSSKENNVKGSKIGHFEKQFPDLITPRSAREHWESKTRVLKDQRPDLKESQRRYEDVMRLRETHLVSCNLVKSTRVPRHHQLNLPQLRPKPETQNLKYFQYRKANEDFYDESISSSSEDEEEQVLLSDDFSRTLNDGSRIIASNHKLSIEVFMPKI